MTIEQFERDFETFTKASKKQSDKIKAALGGVREQLAEMEQKIATGDGFLSAGNDHKSLGAQFTASDEFEAFASMGGKGRARFQTKAAVTTTQVGSTDMRGIEDYEAAEKRPLQVRQLLRVSPTEASAIEYIRESGYTNAAAIVAETGAKPESAIDLEKVTTTVKTIATHTPASKQAMDDLPQLQAIIDDRLTFMVDEVEDNQILNGDSTGDNLDGLMNNAADYDVARNVAGDTNLDLLSHAKAQVTIAEYNATGIILHPDDYERLTLIKDGEGRYIGGGPFAGRNQTIWQLPVAMTTAMTEGEFLVGAFGLAAKLFDRQETTVEISDEDRDNFIKNMLTIRAEKRVALTVSRPEALVKGAFA